MKRRVQLRLPGDLVDWIDAYALAGGWRDAQATSPGGVKEGDVGRTALIEDLLVALRAGQIAITPRPRPRQGTSMIAVQIVHNQQPLRAIPHAGQTYVEVPPVGAYSIRLRNPGASRLLVVLSVDGRNVLDGKSAGYDGLGYVLDAYTTVDVPGFLVNGETAAKFTFSTAEDAYVAVMGDGTRNVGVIGAAVFREKAEVAIRATWSARSPDDSYHRASAVLRSASGGSKGISASVGTAFGQATDWRTRVVDFQRATTSPAEVVTLRYATREQLVAWGVPVDTAPVPSAFPASEGCPPPAGWRG